MSLSNIELATIIAMTGVGKLPYTGGPAGSLSPAVAQTLPWEICNFATTPVNGAMHCNPVWLNAGNTIKNINFVTAGTPASGPTHLFYVLYDDGRSSTTAGQLGWLAQTADQGAGAIAANTNIGLALTSPYTTTYTGIYFVGFLCTVSTTMPTLSGSGGASIASVTCAANTGAFMQSRTSSTALTAPPSPTSGAMVGVGQFNYAYLS
jgi:hypothetical protein